MRLLRGVLAWHTALASSRKSSLCVVFDLHATVTTKTPFLARIWLSEQRHHACPRLEPIQNHVSSLTRAEGGHRPSRPGRSQRPRVRSMRTRADRRCQRASYHCELAPYRCELAPYRCGLAPYRCGLAPYRCGLAPYRCGLAPYRCELAPYRCGLAPYRCGLAPYRCGFDADRPGRLGRLGR